MCFVNYLTPIANQINNNKIEANTILCQIFIVLHLIINNVLKPSKPITY